MEVSYVLCINVLFDFSHISELRRTNIFVFHHLVKGALFPSVFYSPVHLGLHPLLHIFLVSIPVLIIPSLAELACPFLEIFKTDPTFTLSKEKDLKWNELLWLAKTLKFDHYLKVIKNLKLMTTTTTTPTATVLSDGTVKITAFNTVAAVGKKPGPPTNLVGQMGVSITLDAVFNY